MNSSKRNTSTATRRIALALIAASVSTVSSTADRSAHAQVLVRRITSGPVSGLELTIEGPQRAVRGGRVQWQLAVHEVTGLSTLRAASGARVRVLSTLSRERAMAEATADSLGRAQVGFDVPLDAPSSFHVVFEAISANNIRRQFDLDVSVEAGRALSVFVDRSSVRPGGVAHAWARLVSTATGRPLAEETVTLSLRDSRNRVVGTRFEARTDARGAIVHEFRLPTGVIGSFTVSAEHRSEHESVSAARALIAQLNAAPPMIVRAAPEQAMAEPGAPVRILVSVRTADGRPVSGAVVRSPRIPRTPRQTEEPTVRTDARGIATFQFDAPSLSTGSAPIDLPTSVSASRVGLGDASAVATVRIARAGLYGAAAVEGRSLVEGLPGRIYARVVRPDGTPAGAGVTVSITGPRLGRGARATTDADGVAVLDVALGAAPRPARPVAQRPARAEGEEAEEAEPAEPQDPCGGTTATGFALAFEQGNIRGSLNSCAPIEPDGTLRVRVREGSLVTPGAEIHATLTRLPSVARVPVHVVLLENRGGALSPIAGAVAAPGANEVALRVPSGAMGLLLVRARPLWGAVGEPVLGGSTAVWSYIGQRASLTIAQANGQGVQLDPGQSAGLGAMVTIVPREQGELWMQGQRGSDAASGLGDLRTDFARAGDALIAGAVANQVRRDESVPALLRAGRVVELPAPESPAEWGTLRDPFRASARFVEGRLALIFQRIENHVASMVRTRRADIAQRDGGRWEFNREIFDAIMSSSEADSSGGARNLGGAPMTIDDLRRLDAAFSFDNVARRITRKRQFALLVALRQFVNQHSLDLRWSWRGDPTVWLQRIASEGEFTVEDSEGNSTTISADDMVDGWGNRFVLRAAPGGRGRFSFLSPVAGYDLVSAGPDERIGTGDDVVNPFVRVLPSGGAYARAVDEDGLIARLNGVELGRATIARLSAVFEPEIETEFSDSDEPSGGSGPGEGPNWNALPTRFAADPFALALVRPASDADAVLRALSAVNGPTEVRAPVDDEPRTWMAIAHGLGADGSSVFASRTFVAGTPVLVSLPITPRVDELRPPVPRVRVGEPIDVVATVSNLDANERQFTVSAVGEGSVRVTAAGSLSVGAGRSEELPLRIEATGAGAGSVRIELRDGAGALLRSTRAPVLADFGGLALREDVMGVTHNGALSLRSTLPADAHDTRVRLVIETPAAIADDPELDRVRRTDPALVAWSYTLAGRTMPRSLVDALFAAQSPSGDVSGDPMGRSNNASSLLSTACSLVVWASAEEDDTQSQQALALARSRLPYLRAPLSDSDSDAGRVRSEAAVLAALATGAPTASGSSGTDPVEAFAASSREFLRGIHQRYSAQPTLLARASAALLLVDPTDARGRQMYERAKQSIVDEGARGALVAAGEGRVRLEEVLSASAAMAIAAQQRGDIALAQKLGRGVAVRGHLAMRAGGEVAFWLLADAAFGVFGLEAPTSTRVSINGVSREVALENGRAVLSLDANASAVEVRSSGEASSLFARWEALYDRASAARQDGPVSLSIQGDVGYSGERAALELVVTGTSTTAAQRVAVEIQLPAGATLDAATTASLRSVSSAEMRDGGLLRLILPTVAKDQHITIPLALRWLLRGTVQGLGVVAYAEDRPTRMTVLPARSFELRERPEREQSAARR
ncbi:MAG: hypothetical protein U0269_29105 [Polyangiales bacterium]